MMSACAHVHGHVMGARLCQAKGGRLRLHPEPCGWKTGRMQKMEAPLCSRPAFPKLIKGNPPFPAS